MKEPLLELLRCPRTGQRLSAVDARWLDGEIESATLVTADGEWRYPVSRFVPRFVQAATYTDNFGLQWNRFRRTQLDSHSGRPISRDRFYAFTGWQPADVAGGRVLDVGCGAGRFTEIALDAGAEVVAVDYSNAVDACWANHRLHPRLHVVQGDVYRLPFQAGQFDFVYCLGVLQHTPDVRAAFLALPPHLRPGGRLAVDLYPRLRVNALLPRYWLRPLTTRLRPDTLYRIVTRLVPLLLPVSVVIGRIPRFGRRIRHIVPVANYDGVLDLSPDQLREWAVLDTYDWFSAQYDQPQTAADLAAWFEESGLTEVWVDRVGFLVGRGLRPSIPERPQSRRVEASAVRDPIVSAPSGK